MSTYTFPPTAALANIKTKQFTVSALTIDLATLTLSEELNVVHCTGASCAVTLPPASTKPFRVAIAAEGAGNVVVTPAGSDTLAGENATPATVTLLPNSMLLFNSDTDVWLF